MRTKHSFVLQYSDVDASRHLRLCDLEKYLLESAGASADQMGFGTDLVLEKYNCAWVLTKLSIMMDYLPKYNDEMLVETWVEGNYHMFSIRNFRVYLMKDDHAYKIGEATSAWTLLNLTSRQVEIAAYRDEVWEKVIEGEKIVLPRTSRLGKIESPTSRMQHTIHYTDLDYNNHCNSCKYLQFMLNADDGLTATYPIRLDINYAKEVHKGEHTCIDVLRTMDADAIKSVQYCMLTESGDISCTALLHRP